MAAYDKSRLEACGGLSTAGLSAKVESSMMATHPLKQHHTSMGQFFLVVHQFGGGSQADQWWATTHAQLKDDKSTPVQLMHNKGFHLHSIFPTVNGGPIFCLWEGTPYKTASDMQDYVDKFVPGPGLKEVVCVVHPIVTELVASSPWTVGVQSYFAQEDIKLPHALPLCASDSSFFIAQHIFNDPHQAPAWWHQVQHMTATDALKMEAIQHTQGLHPHAFWPTSCEAGIKYYLWEAKAGRTKDDLQAALEGSGPHMAGREVMVTHLYEVDKGGLDMGKGLVPCWLPVGGGTGSREGNGGEVGAKGAGQQM
jgi:hypothetical protein